MRGRGTTGSIGRVAASALAGAAAGLLALPGAATAAGGSWAPGPDLADSRVSAAAAQIGDSVLIAGGRPISGPTATATAERLVVGPAWAGTGGMNVARARHLPAVLPGNQVLVAGGVADTANGAALANAEVWNPLSGTFTPTGPMNAPRQAFTLTALPSGHAVATGGSATATSGAGAASAEIFDPASGRWVPTGSLNAGRLGHSATLLPSCRILIVGDNPVAELYDVATGTFAPTGSETGQRSYHTATLLADGRVLLAGGVSGGNVPLATANVYDPATGAFTPTGPMTSPHSQGSATLLRDGRVVVSGGFSATNVLTAAVDVYDPTTNTWSAGPPMPYTSFDSASFTQADGRVLVVGGSFDPGSGRSTAFYTPDDLGRPPVVAPTPGSCAVGVGAPTPPTPPFVPAPVAPPAIAAPPATTPPVTGRFPAKLQVRRASVSDGELDVLADITARANGDDVKIEFHAAGVRTRFTEEVEDGRLRFTRKLTGKQRRVRTGIITYEYEGNARVRPTEVRLRAANGRARLKRGTLSLRDGRLRASGTISSRASGVVRLIFTWNGADGTPQEHQARARIRDGRWSTSTVVPTGGRAGGYLNMQYTGNQGRRMRGEQTAKQVDASR